MRYLTILVITFLIFLVGCSNSSSDYGAENNEGSSNKYIKNNINIIDIKEAPIKNNEGKIETIKFSLIINPETPLQDGEYSWNPCWLHSLTPHEVYWPRDKSYNNVTLIGGCKNENVIVVKDNAFEFVLDDDAINHIVKYKLGGPYLLFIFDSLYQYNVGNIRSITYKLNIEDVFTEQPQFEEDKKIEYEKNVNRPYTKLKYYRTNVYTYDQFVKK